MERYGADDPDARLASYTFIGLVLMEMGLRKSRAFFVASLYFSIDCRDMEPPLPTAPSPLLGSIPGLLNADAGRGQV